MADLPGKTLARELIDESEAESRATPMEDVIAAVRETNHALAMDAFRLSASVGWAIYPGDAQTVGDLMSVADLALQAAKQGGKDRAESTTGAFSS